MTLGDLNCYEGNLEDWTTKKERHRIGSHTFGKANYFELEKYFEKADQSTLEEARREEENWNSLLAIHKEGVKKCVAKVEAS